MKYEGVMTLLIGVLIGMIIAMIPVSMKWEHQNTIIKHECGQYNSKTGDFEWLKELPNE